MLSRKRQVFRRARYLVEASAQLQEYRVGRYDLVGRDRFWGDISDMTYRALLYDSNGKRVFDAMVILFTSETTFH
jgi:hypothetical protein